MGLYQAQMEKFDDSMQSFNKAIELEPENVENLILKGATQKNSGKLEEALLTFDKVLEKKPDNIKVR